MIIPPSIAMIIYGIITETSIVDLFLAGVLPGLLLAVLLAAYALWANWEMERSRFDIRELVAAVKDGIFSLMLPVILLGGIYSGYFTATEAAAVTLFYAIVIELIVHRDMKPRELIDIVLETTLLLGMLLPLLAIASSLNTILQFEGIPQHLATYISQAVDNRWLVMISVNLLLLVAGCFMDSISALIILSGILLPIVQSHGFNPVHFGVIMVMNLEIGFVTPPVGLNILVATIAFKEQFSTVIASVIPFLIVMLIGLAIVTAVPQISLILLR
jgi:C4-dicarboxylate transporter DctM subunit